MEEVIGLLTNLLKSGSSESLNIYLNSCAELKVFRQKNESEVIAYINGLLNETGTRDRGLMILKVYISQSTKSSISPHLFHWCNICLGVCHSGNTVALSLLGTLFEVSASTESRKQITQDFIPKFLEFVLVSLKDNKQPLVPLLQCFQKCLESYGKSCVSYKEGIESELLNLLSKDETVLNLMTKCFFLLLCTGASGVENANYALAWKKKHLMIINNMHQVADKLFSQIIEIQNTFERSTAETDVLPITLKKEKSSLLRIQKLTQIFCGLGKMLETFYLGGFVAKKTLVPEALLGIIWRVLSVTYATMKEHVSLEGSALKGQLPNLHIAALKVLNSFMLCGRCNILPYASIIAKMLIQMLKVTNTSDVSCYGQEKSLIHVRETAYKCLLTWVNITRSGCSLISHTDVLIDSICSDVLYHKPAVVLNVEAKQSVKSKKKKNKNFVPANTVQFDYQIDPCANSRLCQAALNLVPPLLRALAPLMSAPQHKKLQEAVVKACFEIKRSTTESAIPYSVIDCRISLYSALLALCSCPHPVFPPPLHYAKFIFSSALSDSSNKVVELCNGALSSLKHVMSPSFPTFNFPVNLSAEIVPINPFLRMPLDVTLKTISMGVQTTKSSHSPSDSPVEWAVHRTDDDLPPIGVKRTMEDHKMTEGGSSDEDRSPLKPQETVEDPPLKRTPSPKMSHPQDKSSPTIFETNETLDGPEDNVALENVAHHSPSDSCIDLTDSSSNESIVVIEKEKSLNNEIINVNNKEDDCYITGIKDNADDCYITRSRHVKDDCYITGSDDKGDCFVTGADGKEVIDVTELDVIAIENKSENGSVQEKDSPSIKINGKGHFEATSPPAKVSTPVFIEDLTADNSNESHFEDVPDDNSNKCDSTKKRPSKEEKEQSTKKRKIDANNKNGNTCTIDDEDEESMLESFVDLVPTS